MKGNIFQPVKYPGGTGGGLVTRDSREKRIIRVGTAGIVSNLAISALKITVGLISHSISIVLDGVNNAGDVLSSAVTVAGTKIAGRPADKKHPLGHGRVEYLSAAIVAAVILYAGVTALVEAVKKIVSPTPPEYSVFTFIVVAASVVIKIALGTVSVREGKKLRSEPLVNSGKDALLDSVISVSVLVAAVIFLTAGLNLEAYLAVVISGVIIRAGIGMFVGTVSKIMGERVEGDLSRAIKETVCEEKDVFGAYDLILSNYGPDLLVGSVNIEVPDSMRADEIDSVSRRIADRVKEKHGVILTAIGVYSLNMSENGAAGIREPVVEAVKKIDHVLSIHGFYCELESKTVRFDVVVDFGVEDQGGIIRSVTEAASSACPGFEYKVHVDYDYSD